MKLPLPVHPVPPVKVHVPEIVPPFTVPWRVSRLLVGAGNNVVTVIPNVPLTLPLELPLRPKLPVSEVE